MEIDPAARAPDPPSLPFYHLPEEETQAGIAFYHNVSGMQGSADEFSEAVALFHFSAINSSQSGSKLFGRWQFLAAKQSIISAYNYRMAMDGAMNMRREYKTWAGLVDHRVLERAREWFRSEFPDMKELRQTVMHSAELFQNTERVRQNTVTKGMDNEHFRVPAGTQLIASSNLFRNKYQAQFCGQHYEIELSEAKVLALRDITAQFFEGLRNIGTKHF